MERPLIPGVGRALAALSATAALLLWALTRLPAGSPPAPPRVSAVALAMSRQPAPKRRPAAKPDAPPKARRSALSDAGEALGGAPPKRGDGR